ncbi:hypothetical protein D1101_02625 [Actinobacillus pleuropneumoniae serovar 8 str. 405]|nr:hypothetical protein AP518_02747 [Actinobacillus pleuropneumoniae]KIE97563.1 hypothetical protein AP5651_02754 [Actinobacillus pleuropneumoniae]KIE99176.1 hypothetical protein AP780_02711 [Actinobacillus pleuropneumoniae]QXP22537.1 hypothetical protein KV188_10305 [Actinobacillus pleuropneumoniae serovar 8 str. 405]UKH36533.1 hypothetical protein D1101_02625 [Actinobacillus pleuropneumoniae serovar 8 str. 405]
MRFVEMNHQHNKIILDPKDVMMLSYMSKFASNGVNGDNSTNNIQGDNEMDYYQRLKNVESSCQTLTNKVSVIESNYLTTGKFYAACLTGLFVIIAGAWALDTRYEGKFFNIDKKFEQVDQRFQQVDQRFQQVEDKIHKLDIRIGKVESRLDVVEEKIDVLNNKFDKLDNKFDKMFDLLLQQSKANK